MATIEWGRTNPEVERKWREFIESKCHPFCIGCGRHVQEIEYYYNVNPPGGYGRGEVNLCVDRCLHNPQFRGMYERLLELGVLEERDIINGEEEPTGRG